MNDIRMVQSPSDLAEITPEDRIAIDTEFHGERRYTPELHLIQLRAEKGPTWLIDGHDHALMKAVGPRLCGSPWILHSGSHDLVLLERAFGAIPPVVHDTQIAAGLLHPRYPAGLARLLDERLGLHLEKAETLSDWSRRPLTDEQIGYAASDVAHLHDLWDDLLAEAAKHDRESWVERACSWARESSTQLQDPRASWRLVNGRQSLKPAAVAVLRSLAAWREERAQREDQPRHSVLSNGVLLDLAKRAPDDLDGLLMSRRAPKNLLRKLAEPLLDAIAKGKADPSPPQRLPPGSPAAATLDWLRAYATCRGVENRWGSRLVLPEPILEQIALGATPREVLDPWRWQITGEDLTETLSGHRPLTPPTRAIA